jgi:hypothetical protein
MINKDSKISSKEFVDLKVGAYKLNDVQEMLLDEQVKVIEKHLTELEYKEDIDRRFTNITRSSMTCQAYLNDYYLYIRLFIKEINPEADKKTDYVTIRLKIEMSDLKELGDYIIRNYDFLKE